MCTPRRTLLTSLTTSIRRTSQTCLLLRSQVWCVKHPRNHFKIFVVETRTVGVTDLHRLCCVCLPECLTAVLACTGVTENGEAYIWGQDEGGRLGHESSEDQPIKWTVTTMHQPCGARSDPGFMVMGSSHTILLTTRFKASANRNLWFN